MKRTVIMDLDGTLTVDDKTCGYPDKPVNLAIADATRAAWAAGWGVRVLTARGMRTYKNDVTLVQQHVAPVAARWLADAEIPHETLHVGKPWCGPGGFYVDDRNLHLEEFAFRFRGPWTGQTVSVYIEGPPADLVRLHRGLARLDRFLEVTAFRYELGHESVPSALSADRRIGAADTTPWALWTPGTPQGAPPAAWFTVHAEGLKCGPIAHLGGHGMTPFALVDVSVSTLEQAFAHARETGTTTGRRP